MNLDYLRRHYRYEEVMGAFERFVPSSDFINFFFKDDIAAEGYRYNYQVLTIPFFSIGKTPHIIHYIGPEKPWENGYDRRYFFYFKTIWKEATGQELSAFLYFKRLMSKAVHKIVRIFR